MSAGPWPMFWRNPIRYCRWAAHEKPFIFYSLVIGLSGPIFALVKFPIDRHYGVKPPPEIPLSYPVPTGPRKQLKGYEDP